MPVREAARYDGPYFSSGSLFAVRAGAPPSRGAAVTASPRIRRGRTRDGRNIRKTHATLKLAKQSRADQLSDKGKGKLRAPTLVTLNEAAEAWPEGAKDGTAAPAADSNWPANWPAEAVRLLVSRLAVVSQAKGRGFEPHRPLC
jgi:hypothetical protein